MQQGLFISCFFCFFVLFFFGGGGVKDTYDIKSQSKSPGVGVAVCAGIHACPGQTFSQ